MKGAALPGGGRRIPLAFLALLLAACAPAAEGSATAERPQPIVSGRPAPDDEAAVALVGRRTRCVEPEPMLLCTGALIAPDAVLTAAHCLDVLGTDGQYEVFFGPSLPAAAGRFVRVARAFVHPRYDPATHAFDVALLRLAAPVEVEPYRLPRPGQEPVVGEIARAVGFGDTRGTAPRGMRLQGDTRVERVEPATFHAGPAPEMSCTGDSGGPVLVERDGGEVLAGITVSGDFACRERADAVRVDALADLLDPLLGMPIPAAPHPLPSGALCRAACDGDDDCPAGLACEEDGTGWNRCILRGLGEGEFGATCSDDSSCGSGICARLEPEGEEACRCFAPCAAPDFGLETSGGCAAAAGPGALWAAAALLLTTVRRGRASGR